MKLNLLQAFENECFAKEKEMKVQKLDDFLDLTQERSSSQVIDAKKQGMNSKILPDNVSPMSLKADCLLTGKYDYLHHPF